VNEEALAHWEGGEGYCAKNKQNNILKQNWIKCIEQTFVQCIIRNIKPFDL
jgi:hypothetical protein